MVSVALVVSGVQFGGAASVTPTSSAAAADGADFDPGMIISDEVFYNSSTMTAAQVQAFLNARVPTCSSGYVCLKDYRQATQSQPARAEGCAPYAGQPSESAAQIIANVATACGINPQALIVLLEKEQGIVSDATPAERQYRSATGYGCPDTAVCDSVYYGFFNQLYHAAWQFKKYRANPSIRGYQAGRINTIPWHPNAACGTSQVYIANQATAGLYVYTPYRPNAAALANLYGTGDGCSSYGNRNFWRMFTDWFGSTRTASVVRPVNTTPVVYTVGFDGAFRVYPGDGRGSWSTPYQTGVGWGGMAHVDGAGDLDGDGNRDVIALDGAGALLIYRTDGLGRFTGSTKVGDGYAGATAVLGAGDFNTDGANDLMVRDSAGNLQLLAGTGTGQFAPARQVGNGWSAFTVLRGGVDFNGDGTPDVIARHPSGQLLLYPGDGRAGWGVPVQIGTGWNGMSTLLSPGDFDGDGVADVLAVDAAARMWLYPGSGAGGLTAPRLVGTGWGGARLVLGAGPVASGRFTPFAGVGDMTGNGSSDVIAVAGDGQGWLYATDGRGGWSAVQEITLGVTAPDSVFGGGDFDRDGRRDLFLRDANGDLWRVPSDGAGGFAAAVKAGVGWGGFNALFSPGDIDGDRFSDVVGRDGDGALRLYAGDGAGGFRAPVQIGHGWQAMQAVFSPGDFDGDRRSDVMAIDPSGDLLLYPGNGAGSLLAPKKIGQGWSGMTAVLSPGDFDGDLKPDVLARGADGSLWLYPGNGSGGWGSPRQVGSGWTGMQLIS